MVTKVTLKNRLVESNTKLPQKTKLTATPAARTLSATSTLIELWQILSQSGNESGLTLCEGSKRCSQNKKAPKTFGRLVVSAVEEILTNLQEEVWIVSSSKSLLFRKAVAVEKGDLQNVRRLVFKEKPYVDEETLILACRGKNKMLVKFLLTCAGANHGFNTANQLPMTTAATSTC